MSDEAYVIRGGSPAKGEITCFGAKNFVTKAMVAALLTDQPSHFTNVPPIGDVAVTAEMFESIGVTVARDGDEMTIDPATVSTSDVQHPHSGSNRIPILMLGALLHRYDKVSVPVMGGCNIGARGVDFHVDAIRHFGGEVEESKHGYVAYRAGRLVGTQVTLPYPSVGATETCLYLSVLAEGTSVISNAAIEPEIMELITQLRAMGAVIFTTPGRDIRIEGVERLGGGGQVRILGDRIEAASWACLACASDGEITVHGIQPGTLGNFLSYYRQIGGGVDLVGPTSIKFYRAESLRPAHIEMDVYPGFSTDWQQPFAILLTQANGVSVLHETVFENRLGYLEALARLGAKTQATTACLGATPCRYRDANKVHSAVITGPSPLHADGEIAIPDLRAGLSYAIAAAIAEGESTVTGVDYLERGYGDIVPRLAALGVDIERHTSAPSAASSQGAG